MSKKFITGNGSFSTEAEAVRNVFEREVYRFLDMTHRTPVCSKNVIDGKTYFGMQFWTAEQIKNKTVKFDKNVFTYCEPPSNLCYDGDYIIGDRIKTGKTGSAAEWGIEVGTIYGTSKASSMVYAGNETDIIEYIQDAFKKGDRKVSKAVFEIL
jgi:hypothetical protein